MYELVKQMRVRAFVAREAVPLIVSLVITELLYKFHSFTLEGVAFVATWYLISRLEAGWFTHWREE
jgi:F0F1-type ATP synthase assembly protein I